MQTVPLHSSRSRLGQLYLLLFFVFAAVNLVLYGARGSASGAASVTVTNTSKSTIQTQLSTNNVWAGVLDQDPNGTASFNALRAPYVRIHCGDDGGNVCMPEVQQNQWANVNLPGGEPESRPFENLDTLVGDVFASGQKPLLNIKFAPDWMWSCYPNSTGMTGTQRAGSVNDLTFNTFAQYMARLVDYYNKGSMTTENNTVITNPYGTSHKITYWELWNEPDLNNETPCAPSNGFGITYAQYATMWNATTSAMLAQDPTLKFVGPATAGAQFGSSTTTGNQYVDSLMSGASTKPVAISFHGYGYWDNTVADKWIFDGDGTTGCACGGITDIVSGVSAIKAQYPSTPIWLTEVNVNADWGSDTHKRPWSEFAAAWWGALFQQTAPLGVGIIHQYDVADAPQFGLIDDQNGNRYMAYYVFQVLNAAFPQGSTLLSSSSDTANVLALAAKRPDGHISVMVVNRQLASNTVASNCGVGGVPVTVTISLSGITPSSAVMQLLDKSNVNCSTNAASAPAAVNVNTAQPLSVSFPGYGLAVFDIVSSAGSTGSSGGSSSAPHTAAAKVAPTQGPASFQILNVQVNRISAAGVAISWQTSTPTSTVLRYGLTTKYGQQLTETTLSTAHAVTLPAASVLAGRIYDYQISGTDASNHATTTVNFSFTTPGLAVTIRVVNGRGDPVTGAAVRMLGHTEITSAKGEGMFAGVMAGKQKVTITLHGRTITSYVQVGGVSLRDKQTQSFTLTADFSGSIPLPYVIVCIAVALAVGGFVVFAAHNIRPGQRKFSRHLPDVLRRIVHGRLHPYTHSAGSASADTAPTINEVQPDPEHISDRPSDEQNKP